MLRRVKTRLRVRRGQTQDDKPGQRGLRGVNAEAAAGPTKRQRPQALRLALCSRLEKSCLEQPPLQ